MVTGVFPQLPTSNETRDALHAYCRVLGSLRGQLSAPHPRWWHVSLQIGPAGFTTGPIAAQESGRELELRLDCDRLVAQLFVDGSVHSTQSLSDVGSPAALGAAWVTELGRLGFTDIKVDAAWSAETLAVRRADAVSLVNAFGVVAAVFDDFRKELPGVRSPVQLWPHHFDLSFEWFGRDLDAAKDEDGASSAQIGFGFSTGDEGHPAPYFYANPWPFDDQVVKAELPAPASWHDEGWSGALLSYASVREEPRLLLRYLEAVYTLASPGLS